jgi:hypothetical protein
MFTFWSDILRVAAVRSDVCMFRVVWWLVGRQGQLVVISVRGWVGRRGQGEDSIYWDASKNRYIGAVSLGFSPSGTHPQEGHRPEQD